MMRNRRLTNTPKPLSLRWLWVCIMCTIPILAFANIVLSAQVSDLGFKLAELAVRKDAVVKQSELLESKLFEVSSLTQIMQTADNEGFENQNLYVHVQEDPSFALKAD